MRDAIDRMRGDKQIRRAQSRAFDQVIAEVLVEPRAPHRGNAVAGLQQRPHPFSRAATYQAEVTAMAARQELDDGGRLAMPPDPKHDALVSPFHAASLADSGEGRSQPPQRSPDARQRESGVPLIRGPPRLWPGPGSAERRGRSAAPRPGHGMVKH